MKTFFLFGKYHLDQVCKITTDQNRQIDDLVTKMGGQLISYHALMNRNELLLNVELPTEKNAVKLNSALESLLGLKFCWELATPIDEFTSIMQLRDADREALETESYE